MGRTKVQAPAPYVDACLGSLRRLRLRIPYRSYVSGSIRRFRPGPPMEAHASAPLGVLDPGPFGGLGSGFPKEVWSRLLSQVQATAPYGS